MDRLVGTDLRDRAIDLALALNVTRHEAHRSAERARVLVDFQAHVVDEKDDVYELAPGWTVYYDRSLDLFRVKMPKDAP